MSVLGNISFAFLELSIGGNISIDFKLNLPNEQV